VLTPAQALQEIVAALDALIAVSRGAQRGRLQEARDKLASNQLGDSANGALDLLAKGNTPAAIEKIAQAIEPLRKAETADARVRPLIALLEQIVISLRAI
jgi:DNA repair ATPase RecN